MIDIERSPIDARLVALDRTRDFMIDDADRPHIKQIRSVYLYDKNERTHCCELTPSYWLEHLYDEVVLTPEADAALSENEREALYCKYEYIPDDDGGCYIHCHVIDGIESRAGKFEYHVYGETGVSYDDCDHDEQMEALWEHFCGNHVL